MEIRLQFIHGKNCCSFFIQGGPGAGFGGLFMEGQCVGEWSVVVVGKRSHQSSAEAVQHTNQASCLQRTGHGDAAGFKPL